VVGKSSPAKNDFDIEKWGEELCEEERCQRLAHGSVRQWQINWSGNNEKLSATERC
jgi:hypothetical protein